MSIASVFRAILADRSAQLATLVFDGPFKPSVPELDSDADEHETETNDTGLDYCAEGQSFGICYVNAQGVESVRRITVWSIKLSAERKLLLYAKCAETKCMKTFRADRIRYCVDVTGEVFEPPFEFLAQIFGLSAEDIELIEVARDQVDSKIRSPDNVYKSIKQQFKHELIVLSAMSVCDGRVAFSETVAIVEYARKQAVSLGLELDDNREKKLTGFIRRLRATEEQIGEALDYIGSMPPESQLALVVACNEVMHADGQVHDEEQYMLEKIRNELLGY